MPYAIVEVELAEPLSDIRVPRGHDGLALIARRHRRPVGFVMQALPPRTTVTAAELEQVFGTRTVAGVAELAEPSEAAAVDARLLTVAICTRDHPDDLARCLERVLALHASDDLCEVLVVDNAPSDARTRSVVERLRVRYVCEPTAGLDFARNRALAEATGELIAFVDDDVLVDRDWLRGLRRAFGAHPDAGAVTGLVLPAELATEAQIAFERRGGFEKSFRTVRYGATLAGHPFYPCIGGKLGTGCNMAFVRRLALALGGFDEALDTGPSLPGGGDTDMLYRVVRSGRAVIYEPEVLAFHRHRRGYRDLRRQYARSWAQGLMAFVAKSYRRDVAQRANLRRLVRWWIGDELRTLGCSLAGRAAVGPGVVVGELWGGLVGLTIAYPRSLRRVRELRHGTR